MYLSNLSLNLVCVTLNGVLSHLRENLDHSGRKYVVLRTRVDLECDVGKRGEEGAWRECRDRREEAKSHNIERSISLSLSLSLSLSPPLSHNY